MDDFSDKLSQLLSDPESLEKIKTIAGSFMSDSGSSEKNDTKKEDTDEAKSESKSSAPNLSGLGLPNIDPQLLLKITSFFSKANSDDDDKLKLLYSIKPYLSDKRAEKIESAAQILKISKYASVFAKDMNIFKKK